MVNKHEDKSFLLKGNKLKIKPISSHTMSLCITYAKTKTYLGLSPIFANSCEYKFQLQFNSLWMMCILNLSFNCYGIFVCTSFILNIGIWGCLDLLLCLSVIYRVVYEKLQWKNIEWTWFCDGVESRKIICTRQIRRWSVHVIAYLFAFQRSVNNIKYRVK